MKTFGLYCYKDTTGVLMRVIDGEATTIPAAAVENAQASTPSKRWASIMAAAGEPTANPDDPKWVPCYGSESVARFLYGVPQSVEVQF